MMKVAFPPAKVALSVAFARHELIKIHYIPTDKTI